MKFNIYDFADNPTEIEVPDDKKIRSITVIVVTGDEIAIVHLDDGTTEVYDSSPSGRLADFYDESYVVDPDKMSEWMDYPKDHPDQRPISYARPEVILCEAES